MEREFEFRTYDFDGEVGVVLMSMWDGTFSTNIDGVERKGGSTRVNVPFSETGVRHFDELTRNEESVLIELFDLKM